MPTQINEPKNPNDNPSSKDDLLNYFKNHSRETIAYVLLILGILLLFSYPIHGGLIIGIVAGIYFGDEIVNYIKNWRTVIDSQSNYNEMARQLILAGIALAFLISAPAIFLGAAISIGIKQLFIGQDAMKKWQQFSEINMRDIIP